jgi:integrase
MNKVDQYIEAATRENTRRSYQSAVTHFEVTWGGFLPATADSVGRYLADHAETLSHSTLKQRMAALAQWHIDQGFPDPTKSPLVKKVLKGIRELHPSQTHQARPLQLSQLKTVVAWLDNEIKTSKAREDRASYLRSNRNKALVLIGFWRAFRSDELCRLSIENIQAHSSQGMTMFLPRTKGDRQSNGQNYKVPALEQLCPVNAYLDWIELLPPKEGPVFCGINRWGQLSNKPMHPNSVIPLLRSLLKRAAISEPNRFTSHSLRRGFASWATANKWELKQLVEYVGWKDVKSAMRYIDFSVSLEHWKDVKVLE